MFWTQDLTSKRSERARCKGLKLNEEMIHDNHDKDGITGIPGQMQGYKPFCTKHVTHQPISITSPSDSPGHPGTQRAGCEWNGRVK